MSSRCETWNKINLLRIKTPGFQRKIIDSVVRNIYAHIASRVDQNKDLFFGVIDIAEIRTSLGMSYYIVDGQHRLTALRCYNEDMRCDIPIDVKIYPCNSQEEMKELFEIRNRNVMQTEYVISGDVKKDLLGEIQNTLSNEFSKVFSNTRTTRPCIHLPTFMDRMKDSAWFSDVFTIDEFWEKIQGENAKLEILLDNEIYCKRNGIKPHWKQLWIESNVYLCVDRNFQWLV